MKWFTISGFPFYFLPSYFLSSLLLFRCLDFILPRQLSLSLSVSLSQKSDRINCSSFASNVCNMSDRKQSQWEGIKERRRRERKIKKEEERIRDKILFSSSVLKFGHLSATLSLFDASLSLFPSLNTSLSLFLNTSLLLTWRESLPILDPIVFQKRGRRMCFLSPPHHINDDHLIKI